MGHMRPILILVQPVPDINQHSHKPKSQPSQNYPEARASITPSVLSYCLQHLHISGLENSTGVEGERSIISITARCFRTWSRRLQRLRCCPLSKQRRGLIQGNVLKQRQLVIMAKPTAYLGQNPTMGEDPKKQFRRGSNPRPFVCETKIIPLDHRTCHVLLCHE